MTPKQTKEVLKRYKAGDSGQTISRELDLSPTQVYYALKKNGVIMRTQADALRRTLSKRNGKDYAAKEKKAHELLAGGMRPLAVAKKLGVCAATITVWSSKGARS